MPSPSVALQRATPAPFPHPRPVREDPDALLPALQVTLAALTKLEIRHEIERDCLEEWSGQDRVKQSLYAERECEYQRTRAAHLQRLAGLRKRILGHH